MLHTIFVASYEGGAIGDPTIWQTEFGDLFNVYYNEADGDDLLRLTLTADAGFEVGLFGFDMAAYQTDQAVPGIKLTGNGGAVLWSLGSTVINGTTHNDFDFAGGIFASTLSIDVDLTGLGGAADNIGIDNVLFIQRAIPEPGTGLVLLMASGIAFFRRRRRND